MLSIGEFARLGQVSPRMLRHYDHVGLLQPERVDSADGYRLHTDRHVCGRLKPWVSLSRVSERDDRGEQACCLRSTGQLATELDGVKLHALGP